MVDLDARQRTRAGLVPGSNTALVPEQRALRFRVELKDTDSKEDVNLLVLLIGM
jgi:hypothetical protein